jgi:hypothetical protein
MGADGGGPEAVRGATVAGLGGVVERERQEVREERRWWGKMNCRGAGASMDWNWVMRFIVEDVIEGVGDSTRHEAFHE